MGDHIKIVEAMNTHQWLREPQYQGVKIMDPDGWDRKNLEASYAEEIDEAEFCLRLAVSTCQFPPDFFRRNNVPVK